MYYGMFKSGVLFQNFKNLDAKTLNTNLFLHYSSHEQMQIAIWYKLQFKHFW